MGSHPTDLRILSAPSKAVILIPNSMFIVGRSMFSLFIYLTLDKPQKINALSKRMISEIMHALDEVALDESVKVLVIRAAGKHFCGGHNIAEMVDNLDKYIYYMHNVGYGNQMRSPKGRSKLSKI